MKGILSNVILMNLGSIATKVLQFFFVIVISRYYGVEFFGYYGTANTISIILMIIFGFGSGFLITREISSNSSISDQVFNNVLKLRVLLLIICAIIFLPIIELLPYPIELKRLILIFFFIGALKGLAQQYNFLFQAKEKFLVQVIFDLINYGGLLIIGYAVKFLKINIIGLGLLILGLYFIISVLKSYYSHKKISRISINNWNKKELTTILKKALPFLMGSLIGIIYHRIDIFMLGIFKNQSIVGQYVAPYNLYEAFLFIPVAFGNVLFPKLSSMLKLNHKSFLGRNIGGLIYLILIVMIPIMLILMIFSEELIEFIFGVEYKGGGSYVLLIISGGLIFHSYNNVYGRILYAAGEEKYQLKISTVAMIVNIILNLFLIPLYSLIGAAISTIVSFLISFLLHYFKAKKILLIKRVMKTAHLIKLILLFLLLCLIGVVLREFTHIFIIYKIIITCFTSLLIIVIIDLDIRIYISNKMKSIITKIKK